MRTGASGIVAEVLGTRLKTPLSLWHIIGRGFDFRTVFHGNADRGMLLETSELGISQTWLSRRLGPTQLAISFWVVRGREIGI